RRAFSSNTTSDLKIIYTFAAREPGFHGQRDSPSKITGATRGCGEPSFLLPTARSKFSLTTSITSRERTTASPAAHSFTTHPLFSWLLDAYGTSASRISNAHLARARQRAGR